ncbi:MAG TPA: DUF4034 domain-containing protein [Candidatus Angelobacter sp.]
MFYKKLAASFLVLVFTTAFLYGQDAPSLGDIARHLRANKEKTAESPNPHSGESETVTAPSSRVPIADKQPMNSAQYAPYATREEFNLHLVDRYQEGVRSLLRQEKFEALDQMADTARSTKARLPGGFWTVHIIYGGLMQPEGGTFDSSEGDWIGHLARLQAWVKQRPNSISARVGLAAAQLQYAWRARGGGYADQVTDDGWKLFQQRAEMAAKTLMDASSLPAKCPEWFLTMQLTARALGESKEAQTAIFAKAVAFEPDYQYFYRTQAEMLMPKWEGEEGEMAEFAAKAADRIGGKKGDMIYYQIATFLNCGCDNDRGLNGLAWARIKRGYMDVEEQYGESIANLNAMAYMAGIGGDPAYADETFKRIGEGWDHTLWHRKENFDMVRQWAHFSDIPKIVDAAMKAADDNLQTADGRKFDSQAGKVFAERYSATVTECLKYSGSTSLTPFDMVLQVGGNGVVEQIFVSKASPASSCITSKLDGGLFPPPPKPDYWIKISLQAR